MIRWTGLAPWEFEFPFPGSLTSTFLYQEEEKELAKRGPDGKLIQNPMDPRVSAPPLGLL